MVVVRVTVVVGCYDDNGLDDVMIGVMVVVVTAVEGLNLKPL